MSHYTLNQAKKATGKDYLRITQRADMAFSYWFFGKIPSFLCVLESA
jgi:hypothetical protein